MGGASGAGWRVAHQRRTLPPPPHTHVHTHMPTAQRGGVHRTGRVAAGSAQVAPAQARAAGSPRGQDAEPHRFGAEAARATPSRRTSVRPPPGRLPKHRRRLAVCPWLQPVGWLTAGSRGAADQRTPRRQLSVTRVSARERSFVAHGPEPVASGTAGNGEPRAQRGGGIPC